MAERFDLGAMLRDVSKLDTNREQIEYISLGLIDKDPKNFYKVSEIQELADNIAMCGLMDPLRVRPNPQKEGRYIIVSGHRRHAAIMEIKLHEPGLFEEVPCIIERAETTDAMRQLRLIYANSDTRIMRPSEQAEQAAQVEKLLYELKEQGYEFPGRMRDHVAQACKMSQSKLARLKVIREQLDPIWQKPWKAGKLPENKAYALAQIPAEDQHLLGKYYADSPFELSEGVIRDRWQTFVRLEGRSCDRRNGTPCINIDRMKEKAVKSAAGYYEECHGCCFDCTRLAKCQYACPMAAEKKKQLRAEAKEEKQQQEEYRQARALPKIQIIKTVYERIGQLRKEKKVTTRDFFNAAGRYFGTTEEQKLIELEQGIGEITEDTDLPFHYGFRATNVQCFCAVADLLGCSIDYMLGRSENVSDSDTWHTGRPSAAGMYIVLLRYAESAPIAVEQVKWDGQKWDEGLILEDTEVLKWIAMPR